jgi:hypothetical protein
MPPPCRSCSAAVSAAHLNTRRYRTGSGGHGLQPRIEGGANEIISGQSYTMLGASKIAPGFRADGLSGRLHN